MPRALAPSTSPCVVCLQLARQRTPAQLIHDDNFACVNMSAKPVSQIGRISNAPPRSRNAGTVASLQSDAEGAKPRSLLPQPGQHRYNTRSSILPEPSEPEAEDLSPSPSDTQSPPKVTTSTQEDLAAGAAPGRLRPRAVYQHGTPSSQSAVQGDKTSSRSIRPPTSVSKLAEPQKIGLGRSQSLRKPVATSQIGQSSALSSHARTQSTSTISTGRRDLAKATAGTERPKSISAAPSRITKASNTSADTVPSTSRISARTTGLGRTASVRTRSDAPAAVAGSGVTFKSEEPSAIQPKRKEPAVEEAKKTSRPAFSTLQQHFTPRKTGKAPTASFIHPAPQPVSHSLPPEIVSLQSDLLQLHLLHRSSADVSQRWEQSAKRALHSKFDEVASLHQVMLENERTGQEQKNLQSLLEWSNGGSTAGLVEHVQILSEPLHELPSLVEPGGRLQRLVADFEQWISWVQEIRSARGGHVGGSSALGTIEGLGDSWKAETAALIRKLTAFASDLERLALPTPGSSIASMVDACTTILRGILEELQIMQKIEAEVVSRERLWVEDRLRTIARDVGMHASDNGGEMAAWRD